MGYTKGTKWTCELIEQKILECVKALGLNRMPSRNEIRDYYGNDCLTNKISKTFGYYGWAERLGLEMKDSDTQTGKTGEKMAKEWLESYGFDAKLMPQNYPFDLFVNGCVKVDVKYSHLYESPQNGFKFYSFRLEKEVPTCDVYILIACDNRNKKTWYVVPSREVQQKQISIGEHASIYNRFIDRVDIISSYEAAFKAAV